MDSEEKRRKDKQAEEKRKQEEEDDRRKRQEDDDRISRQAYNAATGDMLNTGIPGGIDLDPTTPI